MPPALIALSWSYLSSCLNTAGLSVVFVPAGGIAPPFKHPLGAGYLLSVQFPGAVLEVIPGACL